MFDWPGNFPGLIPIENSWSYMKKRLAAKEAMSLLVLKEAIKKMWVMEMDSEYFKSLARSMPKRIKMILKSKGNMPKYILNLMNYFNK